MLLYYVIFEGGGKEDGRQVMYVVIGLSILAVVAAAFFLRKLIRIQRFEKYSTMTVTVFKNNRWNCPFCRNENKLLAPCTKCGIYPILVKQGKEPPKVEIKETKKHRSRREQKDYDDYTPQFKM